MKNLEVCVSPDLIHLYTLEKSTVIVVDILRATSCMTAGIGSGVGSIFPFASKEECLKMRPKGYTIAGERNGQKIEGFDIGNSPFQYMDPALKNKNIAVTTTNGTRAIESAKNADKIIIGSFLNITAVAEELKEDPNNIIIFCAGWKGKVNLEDTLFAGALANLISDNYDTLCDSTLVAKALYNEAKYDMLGFLKNSSHVNRLKKLGIEKDIAYCLEMNKFDIVPQVINGVITA